MDWAIKAQYTHQHREEAILSIISEIDKPSSPSGEAIQEFYSQLHGRQQAKRRAFRQSILDVGLTDIQDVASRYFQQQEHTKVVVTNATTFKKEQLKGFTIFEL